MIPTIDTYSHIPVFVLYDYMSGTKTSDVIDDYRSHIQKCKVCKESVEYAEEHRAQPNVLQTPEGAKVIPPTNFYEGQLSPKHEEWLIYCLRKHHNHVEIVAGEAIPSVYTEKAKAAFEEILCSIHEELALEDKVKVVCGPIIAIRDEYKNKRRWDGTILTSLAKDKNFLLFYSNRRQNTHFRIGGKNKEVYVEEPHEVSQQVRKSYYYCYNPLVCGRYAMKFQNIILNSRNVRVSKHPETDFFFLTQPELRKLRDLTIMEGLRYNELTKEVLADLIETHRDLIYSEQ